MPFFRTETPPVSLPLKGLFKFRSQVFDKAFILVACDSVRKKLGSSLLRYFSTFFLHSLQFSPSRLQFSRAPSKKIQLSHYSFYIQIERLRRHKKRFLPALYFDFYLIAFLLIIINQLYFRSRHYIWFVV